MKKNINSIKVIIGICTYNRANALEKCLNSVLRLDYDNYEVCVIDNCSSDNTKEVVNKFKDVKYLYESKLGVSYARNAFLNYCRNERDVDYIAFIDDDETVGNGWINAMLECFRSNDKIAVVCGPYFPVYFEVDAPSWIPDGIHNINEFNRDVNVCYKKFGVVTGNCMCRYDVIKNSNIRFKEELGRVGDKVLGGEDTEFFDRLVQGKYLFGYTFNAPVYHYIEKDRLTFSYFTKRYFYQGVSEYIIKGYKRILISIPKVIGQFLRLLFVIFTFDKKKIANNFFKLVKTIGVLCGPFF